jgi:para-nitrobenzyl esterase
MMAAAGILGLGASAQAKDRGLGDCRARVTQGWIRGIRKPDVDSYYGIPYAGDPSGARRFQAAAEAAAWGDERDCTRLRSPAFQPPGGAMGLNEPPPSEDCLYLNIWTPRGGGARKPVMFYSHGGGFTSGSGGNTLTDGSRLAHENDVVVVTHNHRLGLFGFLYLDHLGGEEFAGSGNRGVQDIAAALKWVSKNIHAFGGDPDNVMIFGESGGGGKTSCLYAMPQAAPFFHKASIESGPVIRLCEPAAAEDTTDRVLHQLGLSRSTWRRLLEAPAADLLQAQLKVGRPANAAPPAWGGRKGLVLGGGGDFGPVRDGRVMPDHPFDPSAPRISRDKPLIVGGNRDEQMFFSMSSNDTQAWSLDEAGLHSRMVQAFGDDAQTVMDAYRSDRPPLSPSDLFFAIQSDLFSGQGATVIAERKARQGGAPVYRYVFTYEQGGPVAGTNARMGAMHALDIPIKFDNVDAALPNGWVVAGPRPEKRLAGHNMSRLWANFARTGRPSAPGVPEWPAYDVETRATMFIDADCHVERDPHRAERLFWEQRDAAPAAKA